MGTSTKGLVMGEVGSDALVLESKGFHSKKYIGRTGVAVMRLSASGSTRWVLRFSSSLLGNEEGLYEDRELDWKR